MEELFEKIKEKVEEIHEGTQNLKSRTDFNILKFKDRVWEVETAIEKFRKHGEVTGLRHALDIFRETSTFFPEGSNAYDSTIWDSNIQARGKMTILDDLFSDLEDLVVEYERNK